MLRSYSCSQLQGSELTLSVSREPMSALQTHDAKGGCARNRRRIVRLKVPETCLCLWDLQKSPFIPLRDSCSAKHQRIKPLTLWGSLSSATPTPKPVSIRSRMSSGSERGLGSHRWGLYYTKREVFSSISI